MSTLTSEPSGPKGLTQAMQRTPESDVSMKRRQQQFRGALKIAVASLCLIAGGSPLKAASAVAIAVNPKDTRFAFGTSQGVASEEEARRIALQYCRSMGWGNPKVVASTSQRGYGAVISYSTADKKAHCAVALAARTPKEAIRIATRKAKAAGGRYAIVESTWNDAIVKRRDAIKL
jgi:hypothetical protein